MLFVCDRGEGDLHNPSFSKYRRSIELYSPGLFSYASAAYTLTLYPNDELFEVYSTQNPFIATVGIVCCIIFTSLLFLMYDFFVRQEFHAKKAVLEAKRQFVRFVSHEVRTPLNTVCMGLRLMQEEIETGALDDTKSSEDTEPETGAINGALCNGVRTTSEKEMLLDLARDIVSSADSAVDVLNDLLNYDKVEMGTLSLEQTVIPFWSLIERTATEFKLPAIAKEIDFVLDYSPLADSDEYVDPKSVTASNLPMDVKERRVLGDTIRVTQVLRNLLSNALKFTPEGGKIYCHRVGLIVHGDQ